MHDENRFSCYFIRWPSVFLRCEHLLVRNEQLRQQLEESHRTNLALTNDFHKLTIDWEHLRDEMAHKEDEWKEEEQVNCSLAK